MPTQEQLLIEVEDLLRTRPDKNQLRHDTDENHSWFGRCAAIINEWDSSKTIAFNSSFSKFKGVPITSALGLAEIMVLLNLIRHSLRMGTIGTSNIAFSQNSTFDYFDEIRKTIELANQEVFFIDPYLDAEFVSRYLPHVRTGVTIRLLTSEKKLNTLLPAIDMFVQQSTYSLSVRTTNGIHDRYLFIDKANCYQSGASFKDGAKLSPTTLTQITDAFTAVLNTYESLWNAGKIER